MRITVAISLITILLGTDGTFHAHEFTKCKECRELLLTQKTLKKTKQLNSGKGDDDDKIIKPFKFLVGHEHKVQNAFFSPNGKLIISHGWDNTVRIWDAETFKELKVLRGHSDQVWRATISNDSKLIASGSMDRTFIIWNVETGEKINQVQISPYYATIKGAIPELDGKIQNSIYSVSFSPNGKQLAVASADKLVRIWDVEKSVFIDTLDGKHPTNWMWCRYSPDGNYLITGSGSSWNKSGVKVIWETETYRQIGRIELSGDILFTDNDELGIYKGNCSMDYFDLSSSSFVFNKPFPCYEGNFNISKDRKYIASCNEDYCIRLWDLATHELIWKYTGKDPEIQQASFSPDGKYLIAGMPKGNILVWKLSDLIRNI